MDFKLTPEQEALREEFESFFKTEMKNAPSEWWASHEAMFASDACWKFHTQMAKKLGAKGWLSRPWPKAYGGQDAPLIEQFIFSEVMGYYKGAGIDALGVNVLAPTLIASGNEEQKMEHLIPLGRGETFWCQCWSEPKAGSDLASLTTQAVRDGSNYIINGQKIWTTGAHRADWCNMLARTDPNEKRSRGLSFFLIDMKTPGITVNPLHAMDGTHLFNEVFFDDVRVPARNMVGEENQGWMASQMTSNYERSMIFMFSVCKREMEDLIEYCREPRPGGQLLIKDPLVRDRLAQLAIEIEAGRALAYSIVGVQSKGGLIEAAPLAAAAKVFATELLQRVVYTGNQIMGMYGQVKESRWAPLQGSFETNYQISIGFNFGGGTSEVMRNIVSSMGCGLPRSW
ncbi:MAG: acyl-CoA dehydrogenase family protein [Dehalococcoidia bacterium]|nr:MAG: acyl-CoA dehydrogenase family protein [Dehalococcoidia bacterium]